MKKTKGSFLKYFPFVLGILIIYSMNVYAQYSDPRMWSIHFPKSAQFYDVPLSHINYVHPNKKTMKSILGDEIVLVTPNFRVHPSNAVQSEVPITRGFNPSILFASANVYFPAAGFFSEGVYVSTNGGGNWFGSDTCKASPISDHGGDPGPGVGPDGRLYMSYLPGSYNGIKVSYSTNYGSTWAASTTLETGSQDKNLTAVDNISGSPYSGRAYVTWSDFAMTNPPVAMSYSSNGGVSWSAYQDINVASSGHYCQGVNPAVGPGGVVYIAYSNPISGSPYTDDFVGLAKSTNGGVNWTYTNNIYDENGIRGSLTFSGGSTIRVNGFPWMAIDCSGGARNGWIYIVTAEKSLSPAGSDPDIVLHRSTNGGTTWSAGVRVNQDVLNNGQYQYMPAVCVGQDGAVNVVYYDTRNAVISGGYPDSAQVFVSRSEDGGFTFTDVLVSDHSFKPKPISGLAGGYQGDYIGIVESNGNVFPYWCDDITGIYQAWTCMVTFEPPCGIAAASNPNPVNGATNVGVNLSQLTWSNGTGDVTNQLYFGTNPTALSLVQTGTLATSWTIDPSYLPLDYFTTYYWKVVEVGASCNKSTTFNFKTIQDPNHQFVTDTLYTQNVTYWTGNTNTTTKTDGEINTVYPKVGWAVFDISAVPDNATITDLTFYGYVNSVSYPYWSATPMGTVNPVTATASAINSQIQANYSSSVAYIYSQAQLGTGWFNSLLGNNATTDFHNALTQNYFAIGFIDWDFSTSWWINFDGHTQTNPPYLIINYEVITAANPTGVSAAPISSSQIDVSFTPNASNNNVLIAWNLTGVFTTPNGAPPAIGQPFAGGTLLSNGVVSPVHHTGLTPSTTYYYKLFSYNGTSYSTGVTANATTIQPLDFAVTISVADNCQNTSHALIFGTASNGTDCYDAGLDLSAPPPPPAGVIDGRFSSCSEDFFTDIRQTNTSSERIWDAHFRPYEGCSPLTLTWNPAQLPAGGYFHLTDAIVGSMVNVNMRTTNHYSDVIGLGNLLIKYNYQIKSTYNFAIRWNMLSLPINVPNHHYLTLFPNAVPGSLYGYSGSYVSTDSIKNGKGYWIKFNAAQMNDIYGTDRTDQVINLTTGWNMIGGPNCNVPLSSVIDPGGIIVPGSLYTYSTSYTAATSIDGTKGYWIKANAPGTITVSCGSPITAIHKELVIPDEVLANFVKVRINDAAEQNQTLYFNSKLDEGISRESYSMPPLPPQGSFDARFTDGYRLSETNEVTIQLQSANYPVSIDITNPDNGAITDYVLQEIINGVAAASHNIVDGQQIIIENPGTSLLKICRQDAVPTTYNLVQNYPNPFNPVTTIEFSLPENAQNVKVTIYNLLGQKVAELVNSSLNAGRYRYQWNAGNSATGLYIYELRTEKFTATRKMLLLK